MNYNSVEEILSTGTTNMTVIRDNTKFTGSSVISIEGASWFDFNGSTASTIYTSAYSYWGFGSSYEHLKVNRRSGALYSLYREEGTLYGYYKFLKIRWVGYSYASSTSSSYALTYDVILWDTGDISLHMVSIPTSYNTGTYSLVASSTYSYTVSTASPDVTFTKTDSGFTVSSSIINLELPCDTRYLIRSGSDYYTVADNALSVISVTSLTASVFSTYGVNYYSEGLPSISLLRSLTNPEILFWQDTTDEVDKKSKLIIKGTPALPQMVYYEPQDISGKTGINKAEVVASDDVLFAISCDDGQVWKYYNGTAWVDATAETEGMSAVALKNITPEAWGEFTITTTYQFRCLLPSLTSTASKVYVNVI